MVYFSEFLMQNAYNSRMFIRLRLQNEQIYRVALPLREGVPLLPLYPICAPEPMAAIVTMNKRNEYNGKNTHIIYVKHL